MIRKLGLDQAAQQQNWSSTHKDRVRLVLTADYMSSESSAEESDCDESGTIVSGSFMRVKKIIWLKKKYRDSFHAIDKAYYSSHKRSRDKLKRRIQHGSSTRSQPLNAPRFAIKSEFRIQGGENSAEDLNDSSSVDLNNSSLSIANSESAFSPVDLNDFISESASSVSAE